MKGGAVNRFLAMSWYWKKRSTAVLPLVSVLFLALLLGSTSESPTPPWRDLGTRFRNRPLRCRVFGQRQFGPFTSGTIFSGQVGLPDGRKYLRGLALFLQKDLSREVTPERLADSAVLDLLQEEWDRAIYKLNQALSLAPYESRILIDASAAYLERGVRAGRPLDLLEALRLARVAHEREPESLEALFNFGQTLHYLHLRRQEAKVWQRYLELEPRSGWAAEARHWRAEAQDESYRRELELCRRQILGGEIQENWLHQVVDRYPNEVREIAEEELLGRWAHAFQNGDRLEADRQMSRLSLIAQQLAAHRGERLLAETLEVLRTASQAEDSGRLGQIIRGHLLFHQGMRSYRGQDFARAESLLGAADEELRRGGSPLYDYARLFHAICIYYSDAEKGRTLLVSVLNSISPVRSPSLRGRALWMLGTIDLVQGRFEDAIQSFTAMRVPLERGGGEAQAAIADLMLAEAYELRGDVERGWEHRLRELQLLTNRGTLRRRHSVLFEAAQALARRGQSEVALLFLDEVLDNAALWRQPLAQAEAYTLRSKVQLLLGHSKMALEDAQHALVAVSQMQDGPLKARTHGQALMSRGLALLKRQPRRALQDLQKAYNLQEASSWKVERILFLNSMARAHLELHQDREARKFLEEAVQTYEAYRSDAMDPRSRITIFQHAQQSFNELMRLSWADPDGGLRQAFSEAERSRARTVLDAWSRHPTGGAPHPVDADRVRRELPQGIALVQYAVLSEKILIWTFKDGLLRGTQRTIPIAELDQLVHEFRHTLQGTDTTRAQKSGAQLYDLLLDLPLVFHPGDRLVIVPDGPLERIPFAALWDRTTKSYLIEKAPISLAPSATLFLAALRKVHRSETPVTLLAAAPDLSGSPYAALPQLPAAREEVRRISGLYPQATVLEGELADRDHFLEALPEHSVLHFAGHAVLLDPNSGRVFLLLAPVTAGDRGEVSIESLRGLPLAHTKLIVLAACRTMNGYSPGREGTLSIASAFFAAGAPTVVAALWDVEDRLSLDFMSEFHLRIAAGEGAADALRAVMVGFITSDDPKKSSPSAWGVFAGLGV